MFGKNYVQRIMIVEDDELIRKELSRFLTYEGYEAVCIEKFENDFQTAESILQETPDLVLLDVSLPGCDGLFICDELRRRSDVPIIFVTGNNTSLDELNCMMRGGDDFIAKPFDLEVLTAKVQAMLRRTYDFTGQSTVLEHKGAMLNLTEAALFYEQEKIELTKNEFKILQVLMENKQKVVSRDTLMVKLWESDSFVDENTLSVNVNRLRKKLESVGLCDFIVTRKGIGYQIG